MSSPKKRSQTSNSVSIFQHPFQCIDEFPIYFVLHTDITASVRNSSTLVARSGKLPQTQQPEVESNAYIRRSTEWVKKIRRSVWLRWWHPVASEWNGAKDKIIVFRRSPSSRWKSNGIFIWRVARSLYYAIIFIHGKALMCKPVSARSTRKHPYYCCHVPHSPAYMKNVPKDNARRKKNGV